MQIIQTIEELDSLKQTQDALLILFGGKDCNVCHVIKPKLIALIKTNYPKIKMVYVDCHVTTGICSQQSIFSLPVVQVFFTGQKSVEEVRTFSLQKLLDALARPYNMVFE
jgi:thioredoxin-like negative regulator of GroEL